MNTHSSRSHTIVQFTIISSTAGETAGASHLSSGGQSTGTALDSTPTTARRGRRQHQPSRDDDDDTNADDEGPCGETNSDREVLHGDSGANAGSGGENVGSAVVTTRAKLSLVDLAGSEKGRVGGAQRGTKMGEGESFSPGGGVLLATQGDDSSSREAAAQERERSRINSSLSALSNCISCLGEARRTHVPFRDNPLTRWALLYCRKKLLA